jgi:cell division protease FtsH
MNRQTGFHVAYWIAAIIGVLALQYFIATRVRVATIPYSQFEQLVRDHKVAEVTVSDRYITGTLKEKLPNGKSQFATTRVDAAFAGELAKNGVKVTGAAESTLVQDVISWLIPALLFFGVWTFLSRRLAQRMGGMMSIGKSKARIYVESDTGVSFDDVAGVDEAKDELQEVVDFLKDPKRYGRLGGRMPKGVLLVGPPGTGKTLLAKAVAGQAKVPFLSISGSEFVEMFIGVGAARVRDLFEQARGKAPTIIFIDELDALGRARGLGGPFGGGHDEKEQTLNQLLTEMDGFDSSTGLVILAATNRPEILDPALLRAGRFDRQVLVDRPDKRGRAAILRVHLRNTKLAGDVEPEKIAALAPGFTGADLANLVNEAALLATRRGRDSVTMRDFSDAVERIVAGLEKRNRLLNPREREIVAHHEMGHAIVALSLPRSDPVHKVSIIPRGVGALGYTIQRPTEDRFLMTREELEDKMAVLLGGRAAELTIFGHLSTGAADDLRRVTDIAHAMVTRYGMSERLGSMAYDRDPRTFLTGPNLPMPHQSPEYADATAAAIDSETRALVQTALDRALKILQQKRQILERSAQRLLETETLDEKELLELVGAPPGRPATIAAE